MTRASKGMGLSSETRIAGLCSTGLYLAVLWASCVGVASETPVCPAEVWSGLHHPTHVEALAGGSLLASEQPGRILQLMTPTGERTVHTVLDLKDKVVTSNTPFEERGLLSFTLDLDLGFLYVCYCGQPAGPGDDHALLVSRFTISRDGQGRLQSNSSSEREVLNVPQPGRRRNGGYLFFGPPNGTLLYVSLGSGGGQADFINRFDPTSLLGKVLRLNVSDPSLPYTVPASNPFASSTQVPLGYRPEIFALGFWNPWRCSVDPGQNGSSSARIFCGDVGSGPDNTDLVVLVRSGGVYGCPPDCNQTIPATAGSQAALYAHKHENGQALIGGPVYRGSALPKLQGAYLFADFVHGSMHALWEGKPGEQWTKTDIELRHTIPGDFFILSVDADQNGEPLLMVAGNLNSSWPSGSIYRLQDRCPDGAQRVAGPELLLTAALTLFYPLLYQQTLS